MSAKAENIEAIYPLSPMQQGMFFHSLYAPDSGIYIGQLNCRFIGELNVDAFQKACQQVVDRHPLLRTAFVGESQERLMQVVGKHVKLPFELLDWRELSAEQQQARLQESQRADRKQGFKLSRAPLMRLKLARLGEDQYHFLWSHHHLLLDGWSVPIIFKEVLAFYEAARLNINLNLPLPTPFQRYISWLQQQDLNAAKAYWQRVFAGHRAPTRLRLPGIGDAASGAEIREARQRLSEQESRRLREAAQREQVTINTIAQGAWALLLSMYSGEDDVVYGVTVSGRPAEIEGVEGMVGLLINSLPVRVVVKWDERVGEWLRRLQAEQVESREYEYSPLSDVQKWVGVTGGERMFESLLVFENYPVETLLENQQSSLKIENLQLAEQTNFALTVVAELRDRFSIRLEYDAAQYEEETMMRMLGQLCQIIIQLGDKSDRPLSEISLLTPTEREEILMKWNQTSTPYPQTAWIHQAIMRQAALNPGLTAVVFDDQKISYAELDSRSDRLARYLRRLGVKPESCVGVLMERSVDLVVSLLGVLKAGGAYVPLDPEYPVERLRLMAEGAGLEVVLVGEGTEGVLDGVGVARAVKMSDVWAEAPGDLGDEPDVELYGESLAYVIYTSGSTGAPKGAMNTHAGILNRLLWMQETYQLTHADRVLQKTPFSFDVSVWEFFWPLMVGAQLVVARPGGHRDSSYLVNLIRERGVTVLHFVPSMLQVFVEEPGVELCASLRQIICSGEALSASLQRRTQELLPRAELDNLYGPTEAAVDVTWWRCRRGDRRDVVPIGYPIANVRMYALDERMEPAPMGAVGELYIGGVNVGRGYLGRADMTAERFVPDPHSRLGGERLYRTGDLGRYLNDGSLEYLGRIDHQIKLHGNRIELGEIEGALGGHPGVKEAVVRVVERDGIGAQLVGYIVKNGRASADAGELRAHLRSKLPEYMVPTHFIELAEMPLTPNGKADRRRLPEPSMIRSELEQVFVAPETADERTLAEIWSQVLRLDRVGVTDNFFALGGDSIRSIQVRSLAQKRGLDFTLQQLFKAPTIRELTNAIRGKRSDAPETARIRPFELISEEDRRLLPDSVEDAYPPAALQSGMLFHSEFNRDTAAYHNVTSYHLKAPLDPEKLREAVARVMARHATLRTSFDLFTYSEPMQLVHREVEALIEFEDIRSLTAAQQNALIADWKEKEKATPFDWKTPPLIRFKVHQRSAETFQFSFAEHHAIIDGWSVATMLTELFNYYFSAIGLKDAPMEAPPPPAYRDFVALERRAAASEETKNFWLDKLSDSVMTSVPRWPETHRDRRRRGSSVKSLSLTREITQELKQVAQTVGSPLKSVLLAAHLRVMSFLSGQTDVLTGLVSNGRLEEDGGEKTLGLFLNTLPFRMKLSGGTWLDLVSRVFGAERELLPHRRYPMAQLQKQIRRPRLFETDFDFTHFHVYQSLTEMRDVLLENDGYEETNFTLTANFSLSLDADQVWLSLYYLPSELAQAQAEAISRYYLNTLTEIAEHPAARYDWFSPLSAAEREEILMKWNQTSTPYPQTAWIHQAITRQAALNPEHTAVAFDDQKISYAELDSRSDRLARYLRRLGVKPESCVGVLMERSVDLVVSLLGVLKAGGAYVPLDPGYPVERLRLMAEDAGLEVVLVGGGTEGVLDGVGVARAVKMSEVWAEAPGDLGDEPDVELYGESLAYVIYTSGSTGLPKGVQISHRALMNFLCSMRRLPGFGPGDTLLAVTSLSFDIAGLELYLPLMTGGRVALVSRREVMDAEALMEAMRAHQADVMQATPATWRMLIESGWEGIPGLKILCGGEALSQDLARELLSRGASVWNMYGPTETTIWSAIHLVESSESMVPIGTPIANTQVYVVDEWMHAVPVGTAGELLIGGDGLARGYKNRPDTTADKFIPNPFSDAGGARLYRTGDLARFKPDGTLEFLGRLDNQVKVRGYRIELGEIEALLSQHEKVREAVVVAHEDQRAGSNPDGAKQLVAYVVFDEGAAPDTGELRSYLKRRLPDYMTPGAFLVLDRMPLTPNGKIDRKALPLPDHSRPELQTPHVAPRNGLEERLAHLWSQTLGIEQVGVFDNFFELGGDSILSLQVAARAKQQGLRLRPEHIFTRQTIAELAAVVEPLRDAAPEEATQSSAAAIENFSLARLDKRQLEWLVQKYRSVENVYPLSPMQQGMLFNHLHGSRSGIGVEQISCRLQGRLDVEAMKNAWRNVIARHAVLRTAIAWEGIGEPHQVVIQHMDLPWTEMDWSHLSAEEQKARLDHWLKEDRASGFDLSNAPLMRLGIIRLGEDQRHFLWSHHHLLLDGWSVPIILKEVLAFYDAARINVNLNLPLPTPFQRYISWLQQQDLNAAKAYWQRAFAGHRAPTRLRLPGTGDAASGSQTLETRQRLSEQESRRLREAAQREQVTINTVAQGAWALLLSRYSGEEDVVYGATVSGRPAEIEGVEGMVGLLINSLPVRVVVKWDEGVGEWLRRLQSQQVESRKYEYSPLSDVQKWVGAAGGERMFESLLVFENFPVDEALAEGGHSLEITDFSYLDPPQAELMLMIVPGNQTLVRLMYDSQVFTEGMMEMVLRHFKDLLLSMADGMERRIRDLDFPSDMRGRLPVANTAGLSFAGDRFSFEADHSEATAKP